MTVLRVILDDMLTEPQGSLGRYAEQLTRELIASAPRGCTVEAFVGASTEPEYERVAQGLPGLRALHKSALARRELTAAWQHGFTRLPGSGMVHAPSLFAPLARHDRLNDGDQVVVTVHDTVAWSDPDALPARTVAWHRSMLKRAERYADGIVVPSHAVATQLDEIAHLGDRVRVISAASGMDMSLPPDEAERAARLDLPERYILATGEPGWSVDLSSGSAVRLNALMQALPLLPESTTLLLVGVAPDDEQLAASLADLGLRTGRARGLGAIADADWAVVMHHAAVFAYPNTATGFGMPLVEALASGTPVVHSDAAAFVELSADAGTAVDCTSEGAPQRIADALERVLTDSDLAERMGYLGIDRAGAFSWRGAAEKVWQLHADL